MDLNSNSTEAVSIENYEIQIFRSDFTHICVYLCRVSVLTTLDIYKDYFKGRHKCGKHCKCDAKRLFMHIVTGDNCPSSSYSL